MNISSWRWCRAGCGTLAKQSIQIWLPATKCKNVSVSLEIPRVLSSRPIYIHLNLSKLMLLKTFYRPWRSGASSGAETRPPCCTSHLSLCSPITLVQWCSMSISSGTWSNTRWPCLYLIEKSYKHPCSLWLALTVLPEWRSIPCNVSWKMRGFPEICPRSFARGLPAFTILTSVRSSSVK